MYLMELSLVVCSVIIFMFLMEARFFYDWGLYWKYIYVYEIQIKWLNLKIQLENGRTECCIKRFFFILHLNCSLNSIEPLNLRAIAGFTHLVWNLIFLFCSVDLFLGENEISCNSEGMCFWLNLFLLRFVVISFLKLSKN